MDAAQLMLDDLVSDLSAHAATECAHDRKLRHLVDAIILAIDDLYEAEREDAHRELDFED